MDKIQVQPSWPAWKQLDVEDMRKLVAMVREICEKLGFTQAYISKCGGGLAIHLQGRRST